MSCFYYHFLLYCNI